MCDSVGQHQSHRWAVVATRGDDAVMTNGSVDSLRRLQCSLARRVLLSSTSKVRRGSRVANRCRGYRGMRESRMSSVTVFDADALAAFGLSVDILRLR